MDNKKNLIDNVNLNETTVDTKDEIFEEVEEIVTAGFTGCTDCCN
ncbi:hypothetical protein R2R35_08740 [Anaerocolumna sp. AGMB13020]|nr:hypothetical protein [Anaerocolumna sp. AGMB13020]WOO38575.1 hypothetical protein R2R35_08740 [Anaerocolumna sp. AGMB13020]